MRRARRQPATDPDVRIQQRLNAQEGRPEPWRSGQSSDVGPLRIVRGTLNTTGPSIVTGDGWSISSKIAVGQVVVTFDVAFASAPTVVATAGAGIVDHNNVDTTTTTTRLRVYNDGGAIQESRVDFIAIGPVA